MITTQCARARHTIFTSWPHFFGRRTTTQAAMISAIPTAIRASSIRNALQIVCGKFSLEMLKIRVCHVMSHAVNLPNLQSVNWYLWNMHGIPKENCAAEQLAMATLKIVTYYAISITHLDIEQWTYRLNTIHLLLLGTKYIVGYVKLKCIFARAGQCEEFPFIFGFLCRQHLCAISTSCRTSLFMIRKVRDEGCGHFSGKEKM